MQIEKKDLSRNAKFICKAGLAVGDYHDNMHVVNFEKWIVQKLIQNIP